MAKDRSYPPLPAALPAPVTDNHAHIEPFQHFPEAPLPLELQVARAQEAGVSRIVQCGCDLEAARWTATVAVRHPAVVGAIAIHPNDAARLMASAGAAGMAGTARTPEEAAAAAAGRTAGVPGAVLDPNASGASAAGTAAVGGAVAGTVRGAATVQTGAAAGTAGVPGVALAPNASGAAAGGTAATGERAGGGGAASGAYQEAFQEIAELARGESRIRAIGETGLDYFRTGAAGRPAQLAAFRDHIALAKELGLALQIHDRDAHRDVIETLLREGAPERTVFHCFSGDVEMARVAAAHGWYCSFAGTVTFTPAEELRRAVAVLPKELVLVETDSPYLTPHPFRGRPNAPYMVALTMETLAGRMGLGLEEACVQVQANTDRVYGVW
jgi:TatD DNase family protein